MEISRKKKMEFENILKNDTVNFNEFFLDVELFRNLLNSDYFDNFINHTDLKISNLLEKFNIFFIHIDVSNFNSNDLLNYNKIFAFSKILNKYTTKLNKIYIYNSSYLFSNLINLIGNSLNMNLSTKIIYK